jgi:hypothetical protein
MEDLFKTLSVILRPPILEEFFVYYEGKEGSGYILTDPKLMSEKLRKKTVFILGQELKPDTDTDLFGFFKHPLSYLGMLDRTEMIFFMGTNKDLFETKYYYQSVNLISQTRIFELYGNGFGRDYNYVKGEWK